MNPEQEPKVVKILNTEEQQRSSETLGKEAMDLLKSVREYQSANDIFPFSDAALSSSSILYNANIHNIIPSEEEIENNKKLVDKGMRKAFASIAESEKVIRDTEEENKYKITLKNDTTLEAIQDAKGIRALGAIDLGPISERVEMPGIYKVEGAIQADPEIFV
ncbi:hypothetical protein HON22_02445, partial [Candidatus Peregrinibacteria bacterium]|nr:hypothetical protein [Candidatus Peregrinibacteria bacterium]